MRENLTILIAVVVVAAFVNLCFARNTPGNMQELDPGFSIFSVWWKSMQIRELNIFSAIIYFLLLFFLASQITKYQFQENVKFVSNMMASIQVAVNQMHSDHYITKICQEFNERYFHENFFYISFATSHR